MCALRLVNLKSPPFVWREPRDPAFHSGSLRLDRVWGRAVALEVTPHHGKMRKETSVLCSGENYLAAILLSWVEVLIPPPLAAGRSSHSSHLYSVCVNVVGCLVLLSTRFVTVFVMSWSDYCKTPYADSPKWVMSAGMDVCKPPLCTEVRSYVGSVGEDHPGTAQQRIY